MANDLIRIAALLIATAAAIIGTRQFLTGAILVRDTDEPGFSLRRRERPVAFWAFVAFFYAVILAIGGSVFFLPIGS